MEQSVIQGQLHGSFLLPPRDVLEGQRILGFTAAQTGYLLLPGALLSGFMMPVVGKMIQGGIPQKYILPVGFASFFFFSYWMSTRITPLAGESDFF
ncbi:multidrug efflux MFS transporter [Hymenobacter roseosalivarius]|uniref:multidrug efflux MFS transporter n=1 Tax=Hymenobacter roseosalivarius TaxID=89967 RepID=UPI00117B32CB|nr:multidrug efflux MFS transporter [Hymenobacter roseosalivarius]